MLKKHVHKWWKKSWSWLFFSQYVLDFVMLLFQEISEKIRLKKSCTTCEKKHIYLSWKSCIIFGVLAPIYLIRKYHIFLQQRYGFLGVGFLLGRGDCSLHPHGLFQMFCCIPPLCRIFIELARLTTIELRKRWTP